MNSKTNFSSDRDRGLAFGNSFTNATHLVANHLSFKKCTKEEAVQEIQNVHKILFEYSSREQGSLNKTESKPPWIVRHPGVKIPKPFNGKEFHEIILENKAKERQSFAKPRVIGRYNSSEIYRIVRGYVTPKKWMAQEDPDAKSVFRMETGNHWDEEAKKAFAAMGYATEEKKIYTFLSPNEEITIVCKPDLLHEKHGLIEVKTLTTDLKDNVRLLSNITGPTPAHRMQVECYLRCYGLEEALISYLQVMPFPDSFTFIHKKDDKLWDEITNGVIEFHQKVLQMNKPKVEVGKSSSSKRN